ncbi:hypothetical protein PSN45_001504 [Yamadazyma tenuis]|uniref:uncharacterized protein n=1 Tax=Candida tenuis TaxID=2315449 RepID=UPI0027995B49|nr:hypothetical protein PSN45_001504 [Yamadazyma tenuis]
MNPQLIRFTRSVLSLVYLILIILSIPLAFDVGGIDCGLTFSFTICVLYFVLATARSLTRKNKYLRWVSVFYYFQYIAIPSILTLFLSYYSGKTKPRKFYVVELWTIFIVNSTPIFTILEGFCSLLSIQAIGQTVSWLTAYKSDSWLIVSLIASGSTITGGLYFLYRIYVLPITIDLVGSSLLGSLLTLTFGLGLFGIVSGKGSIIESSLLFAYIVRCIYETFPQLRDNANQAITDIFTNTRLLVEIPMLSPHLSNTISTILPFLAANVPASFRTMYEFLNVSITKLPIPVLFNFSYRITLSHNLNIKARNMRQQFSSDKPPSTIVRLIYSYSPCIIIPVYTHLLMSYHGELATHLKFWDVFGSGGSSIVQLPIHPVKFWNWVNMGTTLLLYLLELMGSNNHIDGNNALTNHWKVD